jgi:hypothetical protein
MKYESVFVTMLHLNNSLLLLFSFNVIVLILLQVGLLGFLLVIGLSSLSAKAVKEDSSSTPSTPPRTPEKGGTPVAKKVGSVMTPGGRRSARIAKIRRKED